MQWISKVQEPQQLVELEGICDSADMSSLVPKRILLTTPEQLTFTNADYAAWSEIQN